MSAFTGAYSGRQENTTYLITAGGWARSGKGTSMAHLKGRLEQMDRSVRLFDMGIKFRVIGEYALLSGHSLDSPADMEDLISRPAARQSVLATLEEAYAMGDRERKDRFYTSEVSTATRKAATVPSTHGITLGLLRTEVETAVDEAAQVVLIDGRMMEKYARQYDDEKLAKFVMGWYFKCDPMIAARRSLGLFADIPELTTDQRNKLLVEADSISNRNRSDTLRDENLDPLREPPRAFTLDLLSYEKPDKDTPYGVSQDILHLGGMAVVDTSYTNGVNQMTTAITDVSLFALMHRGLVSYEEASAVTLAR